MRGCGHVAPGSISVKNSESESIDVSNLVILGIAFGDPDYAALRLIQTTQRGMLADSGETDQLFRRKVDSHSSSNWTLRA